MNVVVETATGMGKRREAEERGISPAFEYMACACVHTWSVFGKRSDFGRKVRREEEGRLDFESPFRFLHISSDSGRSLAIDD